MYNPDLLPDTERDYPFLKPSGPMSMGLCGLKEEWQKIGSEALKEANKRGYKKHNHENYTSLCDFIMKNQKQLFVEGIDGGLSGKTLGAEIAFRNEFRVKELSINDLARKGIITIIDGGELK